MAGELRASLRNFALKGASLGLERGCRMALVLAAAPALGRASFGRFQFATTVTAMLALGTDLGLGVWTTRTLACGSRDGAAVLRVGLRLRALAALPYALAAVLTALVAGRGETRVALALLAVSALAGAFVDHFGAVLRGHERFSDEARLNAARAALTSAAGLAALGLHRTLPALCAALAAAGVASALYGLAVLRADRGGFSLGGPLDRALAREALREGLPIWIAGLLSLLYFKSDAVLLKALAGDAELGTYGAAYKLFEGAMILPSVLLSVLFPRLARAHADPPLQRRLEKRLGGALFALGVALGAACLLGGTLFVRVLFGPEFAGAVAPLRVLALGLPLLCLNFGLTHFLIARGLGRTNPRLALMMLALNVPTNLVLIPRYGARGAAWATVLTEVALSACCLAALTALSPRSVAMPSNQEEARRDRTAE